MTRQQEKAMFAKRNTGNPRSPVSPQMVRQESRIKTGKGVLKKVREGKPVFEIRAGNTVFLRATKKKAIKVQTELSEIGAKSKITKV